MGYDCPASDWVYSEQSYPFLGKRGGDCMVSGLVFALKFYPFLGKGVGIVRHPVWFITRVHNPCGLGVRGRGEKIIKEDFEKYYKQ